MAERLTQRVALQQFCHEKRRGVNVADVVQRQDVGMVERAGGACLLLEPAKAVSVARELSAQHFDRDESIESGITGAIDLAHPADAEHADNLVWSESRTRCQVLRRACFCRFCGRRFRGIGSDWVHGGRCPSCAAARSRESEHHILSGPGGILVNEPYLASGSRLGPYEIVGLLGAGGMGEVYRAQDPRLHRELAIKVLPAALAADPERLRRFRREATAAAALNHPNICTIHEIGDAEGRAYIAMEYVAGATLRESLSTRPLQPSRVVSIGLQIADALDAAHSKHIVHRDLKSANIILTPREQIKILDFGLAKQLLLDQADIDATTLSGATQDGVVLGTLAYMPPEQALGPPGRSPQRSVCRRGCALRTVDRALAFRGRHGTPGARRDPAPDTSVDLVSQPRGPLRSGVDSSAACWRRNRPLGIRQPGSFDSTSSGSRTAAGFRLRRRRHLSGDAQPVALISSVLVVITALLMLRFGPFRQRALPTTERTSVVALPAQVYGAPEFAYLTDAVPATLSTHLAQIKGLDTKVPPTKLELEPIRGDLERVANVYGVSACILTSVTAEGDRLALDVQLVDPRTRRVRWSHQYRRPARPVSRCGPEGCGWTSSGARAGRLAYRSQRGPDDELGGRAGTSTRTTLFRSLRQSS